MVIRFEKPFLPSYCLTLVIPVLSAWTLLRMMMIFVD